MNKKSIYNLNFGPQHPATHGVLRLVIGLLGEKIISASPHIGLSHRGTEKLIEYKTYLQAIPYMDRLDYVSMLFQEQSFAFCIEKLIGLIIPVKVKFIRMIIMEITRILNHLMAITTHAMDVGAMTPLLWGFEEREKLMEFYERFSGARMHASYIRPGGVKENIPFGLLQDIQIFVKKFIKRIDECEILPSNQPIWVKRLRDIGIVSKKLIISWGFSGVISRSAGLAWDLRLQKPYELYNEINFYVPTSSYGDCLDRYNLRVEEMRQSCNVIISCIQLCIKNYTGNLDIKFGTERLLTKTSMEGTINHFKYFSNFYHLRKNTTYQAVEAPKGEFGLTLLSYKDKILRCKIRSPGFFHLQGIDFPIHKNLVADVVTVIGSLDIVFGETDR